MKRALTYDNIINQEFDLIPFKGEWEKAFGKPAYGNVWFVWGDSGSGKSGFIVQLIKELAHFGNKIIYNALEEYQTKSYKDRMLRYNMVEVRSHLLTIKEQLPELSVRLRKRNSASIVVIDSIQFLNANKKQLKAFFEEFKHKTIIIVSQAERGKERGSLAVDANFEAYMKIYIDKYVAYFKGREEVPTDGGEFVIWRIGAEKLGYKVAQKDKI